MKRATAFAWPLVGMLVLAFEAAVRSLLGVPMPWPVIVWGAVGWWEWLLLAPLIVLLTMRFPYQRGRRGAFALVNAVAPFAFSAMHSSIYFSLRTLVTGWPGEPGQPLAEVWSARVAPHLILDALVYSATVLATHVVIFLRRAWEREEERLALEKRIAHAQIDLLRVQLPPQAIHEKLLGIEAAIEGRPDLAERRIAELSAFLRQCLGSVNAARATGEDDVPVGIHESEVADAPPRPLPVVLRFLIVLGIVPAVLVVLQAFLALGAIIDRRPIAWGAVVESLSLSWFAWPVTLLMVWLASRTQRIAFLACVAAAAPPLWDLTFHTLLSGWSAARTVLLSSSRTVDFLIFFGIALGALAHQRYRRWRQEAVEVAELDARLLRMRVTLLRLQLNPHFLFNTLNSIAALLDDSQAARTMASRLRLFVDRVLTTFHHAEVPLREEVELLAAYAGIENVRFGERLLIDLRIAGDAESALVPSLLLQPLVENALRHGLRPATGGIVTVTARVSGGELQLEVRDNGRARGPIREGIGLSNTRARLRQMYPDAFTFEVSRDEHGFRAALAIPFRPASLPALAVS
jgi:Histidine kinase